MQPDPPDRPDTPPAGEPRDPTDWDGCYREGTTPWEKGAPAPPLVDYLADHPGALGGAVLVPGCGLGHDVRAIAAAAPDSEVVGLDIAPRAIAAAESFPRVGGERYVCADLFQLPRDLVGRFDAVFEHTCLSALPPSLRGDYVAAFARALRPGGRVVAIFFLKPWDDDETPEPPPYGITTAELDDMFADDFELLEEWRPRRCYPGREGRELVRILKKGSAHDTPG